MPQYRNLHVKILDSQDFSDMPDDFTRVMWVLFIVALDSAGRGIDNPAWLRSKLFPYRSDVDLEQIEKSMQWLAARKMINRYTVNGRKYFEVPTFKDYQRGLDKEAKSVLPANPDLLQSYSEPTPEEVSTNSSTSVFVYESASVSESDSVLNSAVKEIARTYEHEIGPITAMIADAIKDEIELKTSVEWIKEAIKIAALNNARSWSYVAKILKNWREHGFKSDTRPVRNNGSGPVDDTAERIMKIAARKEAEKKAHDNSD